jgi:hypothetical protein
MGATLAATLASIQQPVWTDLFYQGLVQKPIVTGLSQVHDLGGSKGATVNFPIIGAVAATKTADGTTTSYATLSPSDVTATAYEIQSAVMVSRFAQSVTPVKSALQMVNSLMAALANQVEKDLVTEAVTTPTDVISTTATPLSLSVIRTARAVLGGYQEQLGGWVLNPTGEQALITDANLTQAMQYGDPALIQNGRVPALYGAPVYLTPFAPVNKSAMIGKGTMHLGIVAQPSYDVIWSPDDRADKLVATAVVAVKYVPSDVSKGAVIQHT